MKGKSNEFLSQFKTNIPFSFILTKVLPCPNNRKPNNKRLPDQNPLLRGNIHFCRWLYIKSLIECFHIVHWSVDTELLWAMWIYFETQTHTFITVFDPPYLCKAQKEPLVWREAVNFVTALPLLRQLERIVRNI